MSADPRDRAFDTLLRSGMSPGQPSSDCLDAETLAAWVDGALDATALARAEAHMANCARCQTVLATLVQAGDTAPAVAPDPEATPRWWHLNLRWLIPLAGAAAAAVLWMVVPRDGQVPVAVSQEARSSAPVQEAPARRPEPNDARQAPSAAAPATPPTGGAPEDRLARNEPPPTVIDAAPKKETAAENQVMAKAQAPAAAPPPPAATGTVAAPASPAAAAAGLSAEADTARNRAAFTQPGLVIVSRDPQVRWRARPDGAIERSIDAGQTWTPTDGSAGMAALAGASPSRDVCWIVGRNGAVALTTDARSWVRVAAPVAEDLVGVEAVDARVATVRTATGVSYRTTDGGARWEQPGPAPGPYAPASWR